MTASAAKFVGPVTLAGICGEPVATDMWDPSYPGEAHVAIAARADVVAIVPGTADLLARLAQGRADDLVTATVLCARGPVLVAPAMHPRMWSHPATQNNVAELARQGRVRLVGPIDGPVASGESGIGRMSDPSDIVAAIMNALRTKGDLDGVRIVVTAGPTHEPIDPVRFLGNRSSGKMGFAIAARAAARGAQVALVAGPVSLPTPAGVHRIDVETADDMRNALAKTLEGADALVMAAAVADFKAAQASGAKLKKDPSGGAPNIVLTQNPDLIAEIGAARNGQRKPMLIAFALETGDDTAVIDYAKKKLTAKKVDLVVANAAHESLGKDENRIAFVSSNAVSPFIVGAKESLADQILDQIIAKR